MHLGSHDESTPILFIVECPIHKLKPASKDLILLELMSALASNSGPSVSVASIPPYATKADTQEEMTRADKAGDVKFGIDAVVNAKIKLYRGSVHLLEADAALIATNESFTER